MTKKLYKYVGPGFIDKVFYTPEKIALKCAYPSEFNDPYELFLTMDFSEKPELLAFYADVIGELPQLPTTCFSKSPAVIPMWAHYANTLQGFVLELDEEKLIAHFPESGFGDVDYQDSPSESVAENLYRAYGIGKFRYIHFLNRSVFSAAYYTKQLCWSYEIERRMVISESEVTQRDGLVLLDIPTDCVTSIVCGPRSTEQTKSLLQQHAERVGCELLQMKIGRSSGTPYFVGSNSSPTVFNNGAFALAAHHCSDCKEPTSNPKGICSWCQIDDSHRMQAAQKNSYRVLHHFGLLDGYIDSVSRIDRGER
jgi:hypothetical protein